VSVEHINSVVEDLVCAYLERRAGGETFLEFVRQLADDELPQLIDPQILAA